MGFSAGDEFRSVAAPSQEVLRKLVYLAETGNGSVLSGHVTPGGGRLGNRDESGADGFTEINQVLAQQRVREQQLAQLNERIDALDRASARAVQDSRDQLDELLREANRTVDGRLVFEAADGTLHDEQGGVVASDQIDPAQWNPDGTSWENYVSYLRRYDEASAFRQKVLAAKEGLGPDPSHRDLGVAGDTLDALEASMPDSVADRYRPPENPDNPDAASARSTSAAKALDDNPPVATLGSSFDKALAKIDAITGGQPDGPSVPGNEFKPG